MNIFPAIQPAEEAGGGQRELPLCREIAWDYDRDRPIFRGGAPLVAAGREAVAVWAWKAIHTDRFRYEIYSWGYGSELGSLVGQACTDALKEAEAPRYLRECLTVNPYISAVKNVEIGFDGDTLTVSATVETIYGEVDIHGTVS